MATINRKPENKLPVPKGQVVACPMMAKFDTIVESNYCINQCPFFGKLVEQEDGKGPGYIECNFPRNLKIHSTAG